MKKFTIDQVKQIYLDHNFELLEEVYYNINVLSKIKCLECKHIWKTTLGRVKNENRGCPNCHLNKIRYSFEEAKQIYLDHNLEFLDVKYNNSSEHHFTRCLTCKYEWKTSLRNVTSGRGCPKCAGVFTHTLEQVKEIYQHHNLEFLDTEYKSIKFKHLTKCKKCDYVWKTKLNGVNNGNGCPRCARKLKYTFEQVKEIYKNHNLELLETEYKNSQTPNLTRCSTCKFEWKTKLNGVILNKNCPKCAKNKNERLVGEYLKILFPNVEIKPKTFKVEIFDNNNKIRNKIIVDYYFDLNNKQYIVEYNGKQHYELVDFGEKSVEKKEKKFLEQQIRDEFLRNFCKEQNIVLIEIDGRKYKNDKIKLFLCDVFM